MALKFEIWDGADDLTYFHIRAANGEIITHSEGYHNVADALETIGLIQDEAASAVIIEVDDSEVEF